ncbi:MAG: VWA domain-containing protein [Terracidiphilus sp.]|jgi:VWFA-related protein
MRKRIALIVHGSIITEKYLWIISCLARIRQMAQKKWSHTYRTPRYLFACLWPDNRTDWMRKYPLPCLLAIALPLFLSEMSLCQDSAPTGTESSTYTLRVNTNLVILSATVLNRHNALVSGLDKDDFQVLEDRVLQPIKQFSHEDIPVTVGLVIDNSASMGSKRTDVIDAALLFAQSSNPRDQMFVVNFNEHVSYGLPEDIPFTDRQERLRLALSSIKAIGETALYDAIAAALDHLKQGKCDKKVLIVISDGGDNASKHTLAQAIEMAKASDAIIYTIGIFDDQDGDQNPGVLKRFAKETGGEAFFPESPKEIAAICEGIARDIRTQYTLTYVPTNPQRDGGYRVIDVRASARGQGRLLVRTRAGYAVPLPPATEVTGHDLHR